MARSILDTLALMGVVAFAVPPALVGVDLLTDGELFLGGTLVGLAVLMVAVEEYLVTPSDVPAVIAQKVVGWVVVEDSGDDGRSGE